MVILNENQLNAISLLKNGSVLCGGVGSGKSRTALGYYVLNVCEGSIKINNSGKYEEMKNPRDLFIITTAKKRNSREWEYECSNFCLSNDRKISLSGVQVIVDSWNNIKKYTDIYGAMFIFDEQRVVGYGSWVKSFLKITRKNKWILLSATPGDQWSDYIPVFIANGFYKNKTEFCNAHAVYNRYSKYPKIDRYIGERHLRKLRDSILVDLKDNRQTNRQKHWIICDYNKELYNKVFNERWDPYDNCPIKDASKWYLLQRKVVNSDKSRLESLGQIIEEKKKLIVFYNFNYELESIRTYLNGRNITYTEWNGQKHESIPDGNEWCYLVQYSAGCEGWNCITTDSIVFYSQNYSYRATEQAAGRIDRINTPYKDLHYYYFRSTSFIDMAIYRKLKNKKRFNEDRKLFEQFSDSQEKHVV